MLWTDWVELVYAAIIILSCAIIYLKTRRLYRLSLHPGIHAFEDAFLFFGLAFVVRYLGIVVGYFLVDASLFYASVAIRLLLSYFLSAAGFSLVYSLVWKDLEGNRMLALHGAAIVIAIIDFFYLPYVITFVCQIAVLLYALAISYANYQSAKRMHKSNFQQLYFIAMVLAIIGYGINLASQFISALIPNFFLYTYAVTAAVFLIFLIGVVRILK